MSVLTDSGITFSTDEEPCGKHSCIGPYVKIILVPPLHQIKKRMRTEVQSIENAEADYLAHISVKHDRIRLIPTPFSTQFKNSRHLFHWCRAHANMVWGRKYIYTAGLYTTLLHVATSMPNFASAFTTSGGKNCYNQDQHVLYKL